MASKRKSSTPCMIPVKTMRDEVEQDLSCSTRDRDRDRDGAYPSREGLYGLGYQDLGEPSSSSYTSSSSRHESQGASSPKDGGTYTCRPCNFETLDLNLFLDHVYSGHPEFRSDPSFHCVDCGVTAAKFEGLALHNARVHPSTVTTTLQLRKKDRKVTVEQSLVPGPGDGSLVSKESEISITKTPIMRMLKGRSESKRIVVSHSMADDSRLEAMSSTSSSKAMEKKDSPTVTVTHVPTIVHNGSTNKVTIPSAIQIVNGSGALPIIKTAVTQVVSVVQNRGLSQHQHSSSTSVSPSSVSATSSSAGSSKNLPKVMIPLSSIPTYNASMDSSSFLKTSFSKFPYPTKAELCYLTVVTKYPEEQIKIWFTAQRLKQGISWSPEEIEEARRKMFNTIIQTAPSSGHQTQQQHRQQSHHHHHGAAQHQTITVLPASLGAAGIPHFLQGSLVGQGGVIVTQPMMANGIQVNSAPVALAVTPKPQSAAKPMMQARPAAALVADKGVSMVVGTVGSSSTLNYTFCNSSSSGSSNGGANSSSSSSGSHSSSSIISSNSISSISSNIASSSLNILSSVINAANAINAATLTSASGKTIIGNYRNASSPLSLTTKTFNANKSTENGKSVANGSKKNPAPSPPIAKTNQDATKAGGNGKEGSSNISTVKNTKDSRSSPDIKISTDVKVDIKTESRSNGASPIPTPSPSTTPNTSTTTISDTAASTATTATVTASNLSTAGSGGGGSGGGGGSNKKGGDVTAKASAASSPSASGSRSVSSPSLLDPNSLQKKKSQEQLLALKDSFLVNQFPNQDEINRLTSMTGLTVREVRKWFSDRRYHFRNLKGPRTSTGGGDKAAAGAAGGDKKASPDSSSSTTTTTTTTAAATATASGAGTSSSEAPAPAPAPETPKTPPPTPVSPPQQEKQTTSPTTPSRRPPRPPSPDFTAIRYKEREPHQLVALEASFSVDPDPASEEVDKLRQETKMTRREIHGWFAERRKRAAVEKKKEDAERAEKEDLEAAAAAAAAVAMEIGETSEKKDEGEEKMAVDEPSGKDEKQKEDSPKVNPIKINLKMLKVTESNGKEGGEASQPNQQPHSDPPKLVPAPTSSPPPIPASSTPYRGKKTPDQLHALKQAFARTQWPGSPQYDELMAVTGLPRPEVVRWFGDCRYVLKNGQLKWLESYQSLVEEEDFHKAKLEVLKEHLEAHGKLDEAQVKELAKGSGLTEDLVRRWFTNRAPLLLATKKAEEDGGKTEAASASTSTSTTETGTGTTEEVLEEKEIKEEKEKEKEGKKEKEKEPKVKEEEKEEKEEEAALGETQQDQGSRCEEKSEGQQPPSASGDSAKTKAAEDETKAADSKTASSDQGAD